jgi:hypothetical protein
MFVHGDSLQVHTSQQFSLLSLYFFL